MHCKSLWIKAAKCINANAIKLFSLVYFTISDKYISLVYFTVSAKGVCNVAKLATLCISISPTTGWGTGQTENTLCVNRVLKKFVPLK